jgi:hypothetical protein
MHYNIHPAQRSAPVRFAVNVADSDFVARIG